MHLAYAACMKLNRCITVFGFIGYLMTQSVMAGPLEDGQTAYYRGDYATAFQIWLPLAVKGDPNSQLLLGLLYEYGRGVPQDNARALKWYRHAADQGNAAAQYNVGVMYHEGKGVPSDYSEALQWYTRSAEQSYVFAQIKLGIMYDNLRNSRRCIHFTQKLRQLHT